MNLHFQRPDDDIAFQLGSRWFSPQPKQSHRGPAGNLDCDIRRCSGDGREFVCDVDPRTWNRTRRHLVYRCREGAAGRSRASDVRWIAVYLVAARSTHHAGARISADGIGSAASLEVLGRLSFCRIYRNFNRAGVPSVAAELGDHNLSDRAQRRGASFRSISHRRFRKVCSSRLVQHSLLVPTK